MESVVLPFVVFGGPGLVAGLVLGWLLGRTPARIGVVALLGALAAAGFFVASSERTDEKRCGECVELLGRRVDFLVPVIVVFNAGGWLLGSIAGGAARARSRHDATSSFANRS